MLKDITIGQYYPGDSRIHRLDPRTKILITLIYMIAIFFINNFYGYGLFLAFILFVVYLAKLPLKYVIKGLKPLKVILIITFLINLFLTPGDNIILEFWKIRITGEALHQAVFMGLRLIFLVVSTSLLTLTTSPISLTDGIELLLNPLKVVRFPAHELAMMMTIALRFIPTLLEETDKIMKAQMARGADFESGNMIQRAKSLIPLLVPLFISAFRRAEELAMAMEARCYRGGKNRTRMKVLKILTGDYIAFGVTAALFVVILLLR